MKRIITAAVVAILVAAACNDEPSKPGTPTGPSAPMATTTASPLMGTGESSVCSAFREQLRQAKLAAEQAPADKDLAFKVQSFEKAARSTCQ